ncbi:MAG: LptF/LptG family permease [Phycisphaerales bacterium JB059]
MPWTLYRYIFAEVARLVLLSTAVLVAVIAFAASVKPLAEGKLGAMGFVRFMLLAIPPMLAYALPFASGFGTTLAYHRLAQDNEILAAKAGGISHRKLLVPAAAIGVILSFALLMLNEQVIPRFLTRMERLITQDVMQIMVRSIDRGDSVRIGSTEIYADDVQRVAPRKGSAVLDQYLLAGVAGVDLSREGEVETMITARQAWILLVPGVEAGFDEADTAAALIRFEDAVGIQGGTVVGGERLPAPPVRIPNPFTDDPKFLTWGELRALRHAPEEMNWIDAKRLGLARAYASQETMVAIRRLLRQDGMARFTSDLGESYLIRAAALRWRDGWELVPPTSTGKIELEVYRPEGGGIDRYAASLGRLLPEASSYDDPTSSAPSSGLMFTLRLENVEILGSTAAQDANLPSTQTERVVFPGLEVTGDPMRNLREMTCDELLAQVEPSTTGEARVEPVAQAAESLRKDMRNLQREITSKQHERLAMAVSCLVMVLTGAVTAMKLRDSMPLIVYLWSFFPAIGTLIFISSGQQMTHGSGLIGIPVLWGGVILLAVYTLLTLRTLQRH